MTRASTRKTEIAAIDSKNKIETLNNKKNNKETKRRQRDKSSSSESTGNSNAENDEQSGINVTPPKQGKFHRNPNTEYSPSSLIKRLSVHEGERDTTPLKQNSRSVNNIDSARKVLHIGETEHLYGREKELEELSEFLESNAKNGTSASMYISGQPGKYIVCFDCFHFKFTVWDVLIAAKLQEKR